MTFHFIPGITDEIKIVPVLISGLASEHFAGKEFLLVNENDKLTSVFEIRYEYHCSPFKQAIIDDNILAVGHEGYFYLFDLINHSNILRLQMEGYFGHIYLNDNTFYVADSSGLYSISKNALINWHNDVLGIDGVIISEFSGNNIQGSGEWDPPGGWRDFTIDKQTGRSGI